MAEKKRPGQKFKMLSVDEILGVNNEESAIDLKISEIIPFKDHPFRVTDDENMEELVKSIRMNGILTPVLVRPTSDGKYEMISGHRRMHAATLAGLEAIPAFIRELSDDDATIIMVDANLQREELLPSEKAFAYRMKYEAVKRKVGRPEKGDESSNGGKAKTSKNKLSQNETISPTRSDYDVAEQLGESRAQLQRYIRLTSLIPEILELVDRKSMPLMTGVEISFISKDVQKYLYEYIHENGMVKSYQVAALRKYLENDDTISQAAMIRLLNDHLPGKTPTQKITFTEKKLRKYFSPIYSTSDMEKIMVQLLEKWKAEQGGDADGV